MRYTSFYFKSLCICYVNSGYLHTKQTEISRKQSEQTKVFKISYYIISEVLKNKTITKIEVRCTLRNFICHFECLSKRYFCQLGCQIEGELDLKKWVCVSLWSFSTHMTKHKILKVFWLPYTSTMRQNGARINC
jgi:hypothetical protein